jgi:hypothetical protein
MTCNKTNNKITGWIFVCTYLFLIGISVLHYHHYEINSRIVISDESSQTSPGNDIIQDYNGNCIVHHFSSNLLNYFFSSSEISALKPPVSDYINSSNYQFSSTTVFSSISLRAPPVIA